MCWGHSKLETIGGHLKLQGFKLVFFSKVSKITSFHFYYFSCDYYDSEVFKQKVQLVQFKGPSDNYDVSFISTIQWNITQNKLIVFLN